MAREAPIIQLVNLLVLRAIQMGASDIHLEPYEDSFRVRYRKDGILYEAESPPKGLQAAVLSRLKIMSRLDIAERRLPQDGRFRLKVQGHDIDFRVSTLPTFMGESMVIRILDREKVILDLNGLGFPPRELKQFDGLIHKPYGMLLVTGPTGSGKTTTLYGALEIDQFAGKEDHHHRGPGGVPPGRGHPDAGEGRLSALPLPGRCATSSARTRTWCWWARSGTGKPPKLRCTPPSPATWSSAPCTPMTRPGPSPVCWRWVSRTFCWLRRLWASWLSGWCASFARNAGCPCRRKKPEAGVWSGTRLGPEQEPVQLFMGQGCPACAHTGYQGRTGIYEFLLVDETIRQLIFQRADASTMRQAAMAQGMQTMAANGWNKVAQGLTTAEEVLRVTQE